MTTAETNKTITSADVHEVISLHPLIRRRRSTRAFLSTPVETGKLRSVLEAARWAPSSNNLQPWRFIVADRRDEKDHARMAGLLTGWNKAWASSAPVLILSIAEVTTDPGAKPNRFAFHDTGLATENIALQAVSLGLAVHLMGGFDGERARSDFGIPQGFEPVVIMALGYEGTADMLPAQLAERETAPRTRRPLNELVFAGSFDHPAPVGGGSPLDIVNQTHTN